MTSKREKLLWIGYALVLILLFLMSSTDLIIKEEKNEIYPISVIVEEASDDYYVNFKKGMDQAAIDYHADISFITLYERKQSQQQQDLITRELNDGTRAIILSPVEDSAIAAALDDGRISGPLVMINSELTHDKISAGISINYYEAGRTLAQKMTETTDPATPVYLLSEARTDRVNTRIYDGILSVLQERGYVSKMLKSNSPDQYHRIAEEIADQEHPEAIVMALDLESLTRMAEILDENPVYREGISGFYGVGTTLETLNYLDEGILDGMIVANDFIQGYLSVEKAVEAIQNTGTHETIQTEYFYINKEDIRKKEYQKLLYPID